MMVVDGRLSGCGNDGGMKINKLAIIIGLPEEWCGGWLVVKLGVEEEVKWECKFEGM